MGYVYKYLTKRHFDIANINPADADDCFRVLIEKFTIGWLEGKSNNVICKLWARPDKLATIELYSLGHAIRKLDSVDERFTDSKIALIKSGDSKNCLGAIFEVLALNSFSFFNGVKPSPENQPGYDGTIMLKHGKFIR